MAEDDENIVDSTIFLKVKKYSGYYAVQYNNVGHGFTVYNELQCMITWI